MNTGIPYNFFRVLICLTLCCTLTSFPGAAQYVKQIQGEQLKISAPNKQTQGNDVFFNSSDNRQQQVVLRYGDTMIKANSAKLQTTVNKIYLKGGFYSHYLENEISGNSLVYNPFNKYFDAKNVIVKSARMLSKAEKFSYYGEKIVLKNASFGIDLVKLDINFDELDLYPGWVVAYDTQVKLFGYTFLWTPTMIIDNRRNTFSLPTPLPEFGKSQFRGNYWRENLHYYVNESVYGNLQFGRADEKGAGYGLQQIFRFSDYDQFNYINENWQYDRTQEIYSFEHSFMDLPKLSGEAHLDFNEILRLNEEIKELPANSLRLDYTNFEEVNDELINRHPEIVYLGNFTLPWQELKLFNKSSYGYIEELLTEKKANKYEFNLELKREFDLYPLAIFTPGVGYDSSHYSIKPFTWYRTYDFLTAQRKFWIFDSRATVTDYLDEQGYSPFIYDQKYTLPDNVKTDVSLDLWKTKIGQQTQYVIPDGKIFDILYYINYHRSSWTLKAKYSLKRDSWSVSIEINLI